MLHVHRRGRQLMLILLALLTLIGAGGGAVALAQDGTTGATPSPAGDLQASVEWLITQQEDDGSFVGFEGTSDAGVTADAIVALATARQAGADTGTSIEDAVAFLESGEIAMIYIQNGVGQAAKFLLGLAAAGENVDDFAGVSPLAIVENSQDPDTGLYGDSIYDHALSLLALDAAEAEVPASAVDALAESQAENGGWGFEGLPEPDSADSNTTSLVIQALDAIEGDDPQLITDGFAYLATTVNDEGAATFGTAPDSAPDANSTALVAQALIAVDADAGAQLAALSEFQNESGAFSYNSETPGDNLFATVQAIPALAGAALPFVPAA
jgi:hypothetical protein